jgi:chlorobactene glucosyltransferase
VIDATRLVTCRMYHSWCEAFAGLSKNLFAAFDFRLLPYLFAWLWLAVLFLVPLLLLVLHILGLAPSAQTAPLLGCVGLALLLWLVSYQRLGLGLGLALLYPFTLLVIESIAFSSLVLTLSGRLTWKGRALLRQQWKWF